MHAVYYKDYSLDSGNGERGGGGAPREDQLMIPAPSPPVFHFTPVHGSFGLLGVKIALVNRAYWQRCYCVHWTFGRFCFLALSFVPQVGSNREGERLTFRNQKLYFENSRVFADCTGA